MNNKPIRNAVLAASTLVLLGLASAHAGEINGKGESLKNEDGTLNGASECAFSGLQDAPFDPGSVQSWGIMPKAERDALRAFLLALLGIDIHPGTSCNPKKSGEVEP